MLDCRCHVKLERWEGEVVQSVQYPIQEYLQLENVTIQVNICLILMEFSKI